MHDRLTPLCDSCRTELREDEARRGICDRCLEPIPWDRAPSYCEECGEVELTSEEEIATNICDMCQDMIEDELFVEDEEDA